MVQVKDKNGYREATPTEEAKIKSSLASAASPRDLKIDKLIIWAEKAGYI